MTSGTGTASNTLSDLLNNDVFVWNLIGGLTQPLFNNGRLKAGVKQNEAMAAEAAANYESLMLTAYQEVESALAAENFLAEQETALETATKQSQAARDLAEERYRLGLADIITLLDSQRSALNVREPTAGGAALAPGKPRQSAPGARRAASAWSSCSARRQAKDPKRFPNRETPLMNRCTHSPTLS